MGCLALTLGLNFVHPRPFRKSVRHGLDQTWPWLTQWASICIAFVDCSPILIPVTNLIICGTRKVLSDGWLPTAVSEKCYPMATDRYFRTGTFGQAQSTGPEPRGYHNRRMFQLAYLILTFLFV